MYNAKWMIDLLPKWPCFPNGIYRILQCQPY